MPFTLVRLIKKFKKAFCNVGLDHNNINLDTLENDLGGDKDNNGDDNNDGSSDESFSMGDTIGKSLVLVKQVGTV